MTLELTPQQQSALDNPGREPLCLVDPRSNTPYYLVSPAEYAAIRENLEDERVQRAVRAVGTRNAVGRSSESP